MISLPHRRLHHAAGGWASWDDGAGSTQGDIASDSLWCTYFDNPTVNSNEVGEGGGLDTTNRTFTKANLGNLAGATGDPPSRYFNGSGNSFNIAPTLWGTFLAGLSSWTVLFKFTLSGLGGTDYLLDFQDCGSTYRLKVYWGADGKAIFNVYNSGWKLSGTCTSGMSTGNTYYLAMWCDGTYTRAGFTTTKPTKWSDFAAANRLTATVACTWPGAGSFCANGEHSFGAVWGDFGTFNGYVFYSLWAKECLIDNAA